MNAHRTHAQRDCQQECVENDQARMPTHEGMSHRELARNRGPFVNRSSSFIRHSTFGFRHFSIVSMLELI
jgi:hypothetical protein